MYINVCVGMRVCVCVCVRVHVRACVCVYELIFLVDLNNYQLNLYCRSGLQSLVFYDNQPIRPLPNTSDTVMSFSIHKSGTYYYLH